MWYSRYLDVAAHYLVIVTDRRAEYKSFLNDSYVFIVGPEDTAMGKEIATDMRIGTLTRPSQAPEGRFQGLFGPDIPNLLGSRG